MTAHWSAAGQTDVEAAAVALSDDSGYFTFFAPGNVEVLVKVLDACASASPRFWFFAAGLTNVDVVVDVTDAWSGERYTFHNPQGQAFPPTFRTDRFATCNAPRPCGLGNPADLAASPRPDSLLESLALFVDQTAVATQTTYERVGSDLSAIVAAHPELSPALFLPAFEEQTLILTFDGLTAATIQGGTYHAWDCLNAWYGSTTFEQLWNGPAGVVLVLHFAKLLYVPALLPAYGALPGVLRADPNWMGHIPETPGLPFCVRREAATDIVYFFYARPSQQFRSRPGGPPVSEPFDAAAAQACFAENSA